jgi:hypothetical protein
MHLRLKRIPMSEKLRKAVDEMGGEPLQGSGFENETPVDLNDASSGNDTNIGWSEGIDCSGALRVIVR